MLTMNKKLLGNCRLSSEAISEPSQALPSICSCLIYKYQHAHLRMVMKNLHIQEIFCLYKISFLCLATVTIFYLKFETCKNLQMVLTSSYTSSSLKNECLLKLTQKAPQVYLSRNVSRIIILSILLDRGYCHRITGGDYRH